MTEYSGFNQHPLEPINRLRNDLGDRYERGFPVLKELIQNADDAQATQVVFGLVPGIEESQHPLLRGRALFVVNNGVFEPKHEEGIRLYGTSNKVADRTAVGKFGLGMKSVFHFCEAFFFLAHLADRRPRAGLINPWSIPEHLQGIYVAAHPAWVTPSQEDAQRMRQALEPVIADVPAGLSDAPFILWLPLRSKSHLREGGETTGVIVPEYPGDTGAPLAFLRESSLTVQLADLLPLLRHVQQIRFHPLLDWPQAPFCASVDDSTSRLRFDSTQSDVAVSGKIHIHRSEASDPQLVFTGHESFRWNERLSALNASPHWPQNNTDDDLGRPRVERDKAEPHTAVVLAESPAESESGTLTLRWAVFLPLDKSRVSETVTCGGDRDYCCTLHGYFFVDAGRREIHGFRVLGDRSPDQPLDSVDEVRIGWNRELATAGTLPLLLPVLQRHIEGLQASRRADAGRRLASAFARSNTWARFGSDIAASGQWVLLLDRKGTQWSLVDRAMALLPLPLPPENDRDRPWRVFIALGEMEREAVPVVAGEPQLSTAPRSAPSMEQLEMLLGSISVPETLGRENLVAYVASTLELCPMDTILQSAVQSRIVDLLRSGLRDLGLQKIRANRAAIKRIVSLLPATRCLSVPESLPKDLLQRLIQCAIDRLMLPSDLVVEEDEGASLTVSEVERLLRVIADWMRKHPSHQDHESVSKQVLRLAQLVDRASRPTLFGILEDEELIRAFDGEAGRWRMVSPKRVQQVKAAGLLFRRGQIADDQGLALARKLQAALAYQRVLVLEQSALEVLGISPGGISSCDAQGALQALGAQPHGLKEPEHRKDLVRHLTDPGDDVAAKRGLRYLLHGREGRWSDTGTALWYRDADEGTAWERLWSQLNEGWNLVDRELAECLSLPVLRRIGVNRIRPEALLEEVGRQGPEKIDPDAYSADECNQILKKAHDEAVWRMLPLHQRVDGTRCDARSSNVYLDTGLPLPDGAEAAVRVILRSRDDEVRRRQQRLLPPFDALTRLGLVLILEQSERLTGVLLDDLQTLQGNPPAELWQQLRKKSWLQDVKGSAYAPADVIDCDDPSGLIRRLAEEAQDGAYTFAELLDPAILGHAGFRPVRDNGLLAQGDDALGALGLLIAEAPAYHLGKIDWEDERLLDAIPVLATAPDHVGLSGWKLLEELCRHHEPDKVASLVVREMALPTADEMETVIKVLDWIRSRGQAREAERAAFELYLKRFAELPGPGEKLDSLHLIDSGGHWRKAGELCAGTQDIERRFVLAAAQQEILRAHIAFAGSLADDSIAEVERASMAQDVALASLLEEFFQDWRDKVPEALIACFVFVCGSAKPVKALVETYRGNRESLREWLLEVFPWTIPGYRNDGVEHWLFGKTLEQAIDSFRFRGVIATNDQVTVRSVLGVPLEVKRASDAKSFVTVRGNDTEVILQLVAVDQREKSPEELSEMLRRSIQAVVENWAMRRLGDLSALWIELERSDQIAIEVSRTLILESLPILSRQLRPGHHPDLDKALKTYDEARAKAIEFRGRDRAREFEEHKRNALHDIQRLIEEEESARSALLDGVRRKISDYQYKPTSIPFELFQNADDAVCERLEIDAYQHPSGHLQTDEDNALTRFLVTHSDGAVTFLHWGRPLNATGDPYPGRDRGFHRDLEKMLIISASDKEQPSTGHFGLGFKSVFLCCDEPWLVSGRLAVRVLGGMMPVPLDNDGPLRTLLREHGGNAASAGTAIHLRMDRARAKTMLERFRAMAGVLCCFAKAIRRIGVVGDEHAWEPTPVADASMFATGWVQLPDASGALHRTRVLRIDLGEGALLIGLDEHGIRRLPETIPTLWILAPTAEDEALGFALNGPFDVDAGRTRLADNEQANLVVAERLGTELGKGLQVLANAMDRDWAQVCDVLGLSTESAPYDLWHSLWRTLVGGLQVRERSQVRPLAQRVIQLGVGGLAGRRAIIPNGLSGTKRCLLRVADVKQVLRGALGNTAVLERLGHWDRFASQFDPHRILRSEIHEWVALADPSYASRRDQWKSRKLVDLVSLLPRQGAEVVVAPPAAAVWGGVFAELSTDELAKEELDDIKDAQKCFSGALFRSASDGYRPASELLDEQGELEERARSAFAPATNRLDPEYDEAGRGLLRRSRPMGFAAGHQKLAEWIRSLPEDHDRRSAALLYLRDGELAARVISYLREQGLAGSWLLDLDEHSDYFADWSQDQTLRLLSQFQSMERLREAVRPPDPKLGGPSLGVDVVRTLERIGDWWHAEHGSRIEAYEKEIYPGGQAKAAALRYEDENEFTGDRDAWLTLFVLGHFHTLGLVGHNQNRGFLEMCREKDWWHQVFTLPNPHTHPDKWMGVLDDYIEAQSGEQTYELWMQRFPAIYRLARYLDDYRDLMLGLPLWGWIPGECRLDQGTRPRVTPRLQRGGIQAPPIHRTLGIGACFVVRELLRLGVVDGDGLPHACAYVPTKGVRDLFAEWGYPRFDGAGADVELSREIHDILVEYLGTDAARFDAAYDIPLQLVAYDPEIKRQVTHYK